MFFSIFRANKETQVAKARENFEMRINDEENEINNLDLIKDRKGTTPILVLQVVLNENDFQHIAICEIEKVYKMIPYYMLLCNVQWFKIATFFMNTHV